MLSAEILRRPGHLPLTAAVLLDELSPCVEVTYLFDAASADFGDDVESMSLSGDPTQPALAPEEAQQADQNARPARALGKCTNLPETRAHRSHLRAKQHIVTQIGADVNARTHAGRPGGSDLDPRSATDHAPIGIRRPPAQRGPRLEIDRG